MSCPVCKSENTFIVTRVRDTFSEHSFDVSECRDCKFNWLPSPPATDEIGKFYDNAMGAVMRKKRSTIFSKMQNFLFKLDVAPLLQLCDTNDVILDWGAGHGQISQVIHEEGNKVVAIDIYPKENWKIEDIDYLEVDSNKIEQLYESNLIKQLNPKAVIMRHTLEHFHYPEKLIKFFFDQGIEYVLIIVPNHKSRLRRIFKSYWPYWDPPRHINFFSPNNLNILLKNQKYNNIGFKTYGLDEIYGAVARWVRLNFPNSKFLNRLFHHNSITIAMSSALAYLFTNTVIWGLYQRKHDSQK